MTPRLLRELAEVAWNDAIDAIDPDDAKHLLKIHDELIDRASQSSTHDPISSDLYECAR